MIDYKRIAKEMARNINGMDAHGMIELLNDKDYCREEHLFPESFKITPSEAKFIFDMSDIRWFNDFESGVEWEQGDEFDSDELQDALYEEISNDIMCEYNRFSFIVKL